MISLTREQAELCVRALRVAIVESYDGAESGQYQETSDQIERQLKAPLHEIWLSMGADQFCYRFKTEQEAKQNATGRVAMGGGWGNTSFIWTKAFTVEKPPEPPS